jgi:hypothetical protein
MIARPLADPPSPAGGHPLEVNGARLAAELCGALWWPARRLLAVADLHLEKGSGFAAAGRPLPPYDTRATLDRLAALVDRLAPETVVCLGDSFHDGKAADRLSEQDAARLRALTGRAEWLWLVGNHDPAPPEAWGGRALPELAVGPLAFRHRARAGAAGEVSGHWHPKATVPLRHGKMTGRCFVEDGRCLVLPAFGAFTGGLNVRDREFAGLFPHGFRAHVVGRSRIHAFDGRRLLPDPPAPARRPGRADVA